MLNGAGGGVGRVERFFSGRGTGIVAGAGGVGGGTFGGAFGGLQIGQCLRSVSSAAACPAASNM